MLNELGFWPDPDQVDALYHSRHRRPGAPGTRTAAPAVLAVLQLHARTGTKIEYRELARMAGCDPATVCRHVHRAEALGVLQVSGGERRRVEGGQVRRTCHSYRLAFAPGMPLKPEQGRTADLYEWAIGAGVPEAAARSCSRRGRAGAEELVRLGRLRQLDDAARRIGLQQAEDRRQRQDDDRRRAGGQAAAADTRDDLVAALLGPVQVQHGAANSKPASRTAKCNGSSVGTPNGESPRKARAHVDRAPRTDDEERAALDVMAYAERLGSRLPWLDGHTVIAEARRRGVPAWKAAREYLSFAGDAPDLVRAGRVARPAAWAMLAFKARMAALEAA